MDLGGIAPQLVTALGAADAVDHPGILEFEENQLEELFGQGLFIGDVANFDGALVMMPRQHHHRLQRVKTFLRDSHGCGLFHKLH